MRVFRTVVALPFLLVVGFSGTTYAQASNPSVVAALKDIQAALNNLALQVNSLQNSVDHLAAPAQSAVRFTPVVTVVPRSGTDAAIAACKVLNVSSATITVRVQLIGQDQVSGVVSVRADSNNLTLAGGHTGNAAAFVGTMEGYCRFEVINGSRADIRGSMLSGLDDEIKLAEAE